MADIIEVNGVRYFKLQSEYKGDYTKNCGLLGTEIDENFYFLRGYDIESMSFDEEKNIILKRVNGEELSVNIAEDYSKYSFTFDKDKGVLTVKLPDGTEQILDGFLVDKGNEVATDATIAGTGSAYKPLSISPLEKTGTYAPVQYFSDLTGEGTEMPDGANLGKGYRIVTKEKVSNFGLFYTFDDVKAIQEKLEENKSEWRVPTREDWAGLLNAAEYCDEDRDHDTESINLFTGRHAGARAKSTKLWADAEKEEEGFSTKGEDNLPTDGQLATFRVYPVGDGEGSRGPLTKDPDNHDIEGFGKIATYWSYTEDTKRNDEGSSDIFTRSFVNSSRKVYQRASSSLSRLSLRLVKDFKAGQEFNGRENILGSNIPCTLIANKDTEYKQIWTSVNVGFKGFHGVESDEWIGVDPSESGNKAVYFINEWNGKEWLKKEMNVGDSVVIIDYDNDPTTTGDTQIEWRVVENEDGTLELIDTTELIKKEFGKELTEIKESINSLTERVSEAEESIKENSDNIAKNAEDITKLNTDLTGLSGATEALSATVKEEVARLDGKDIAIPEEGYNFKANEENKLVRENGEEIPFSFDFNFGER